MGKTGCVPLYSFCPSYIHLHGRIPSSLGEDFPILPYARERPLWMEELLNKSHKLDTSCPLTIVGWLSSLLMLFKNFSDDTLVFFGDSGEWLMYLRWILLLFEALSDIRMIMEKSVLLPVGNVEEPDLLAQELGAFLGLFRPPILAFLWCKT